MKRTVVAVLAGYALVAPWEARAEELTEEQIKLIIERAKPWIEAEVERRVKEELEKQKAAEKVAQPAPAPPSSQIPITPSSAWSPSQPIPLVKAGNAYMNASVVVDTVFGWSTTPDVEDLQGAHHDPSQRGFTLQGAELTLDGAVDPYFKGLATMSFVLEPGGETAVELEEAYVQTLSLPWNLQARAGQFFAEFGRQNILHNHTWSFVDQPLVITRLLGPDGLRNPGARLSWLAPTPFYSEVMLGVFNSDGETAAGFRSDDSIDIHGGEPVDRSLRGPQDLLFVPRVAASFDLSDTQTLLLGASAALGPNNSGRHACTQLYGGDLYWKWRPENAEAGFPFVSWQTEGIFRRYEADSRMTPDDPPGSAVPLPQETLHDWGFYSQLLWGFRRGWVAGMRGEFVSGDDGKFESDIRVDRTRLSPNLTWYPTEFSKLRLQYNYDHIQHWGDEHSLWFQIEFLLGAHAAHKF
jgi:hypothetical protein